MQLATCSYAEFKPEMGHPVRISLGKPRWPLKWELKDYYWPMTPRPAYLRSEYETYLKAYTAQLDRHTARFMEEELETLARKAGADTLVLLCFEKLASGSWCHRTMLADWWLEATGEPIPELGKIHPDTPPPLATLFDG